MRFIGNKEKLVDYIFEASSSNSKFKSFFDFFSGTANVGKYFKQKGFKVYSSDLLYFSYVLQKAYICNNSEPDFSLLTKSLNNKLEPNLETIIEYLNNIKPIKNGFIFKNYTEEGTANNIFKRKYFIASNAQRIDAIREMIENWKLENLIGENEYYILLACLVESVPFYANISGVYAAFLKQYDPRALKPFTLRPVKIYKSKFKHQVYNSNSIDLLDCVETDILYLDPPYNSRQYAPNYHLLETIAKYDNPEIKGLTGLRDYADQKSDFCNKEKAYKSFKEIFERGKFKKCVLSYNSEGLLSKEEILDLMQKHGKASLIEMDYLRYKSNSRIDHSSRYLKEQLYILEKN